MPASRFQKYDRKLRVVVTRRLPQAVETRMAELFDVTLNLEDAAMDRARLAAAMAQADVLVPTVTDDLDAALLAGAGADLKLIANFGAGVDHIDLTAARAKGVTVTNTPGVLNTLMPLLHWAMPSKYHSIHKNDIARAMVTQSEQALAALATAEAPRASVVKRLEYRDMQPFFVPGDHLDG